MLLLFTSSCKMSHFGINPVSGGRLPSDIRVIMIIMVIGVDLFHRLASDLILVTCAKFRVKKMVVVMIM